MTALSHCPAGSAPTDDDAPGLLGENVRRLRRERGLTLVVLALRSGVSRAMISKIERGGAVPTATVLGKLAAGLEVGLTQLLGGQRPRAPLLLGPAEQPMFRDPASGLERRSLSPFFPDRTVDFALNTLPAGGRVAFPGHEYGVEEYLFVQRGSLVVVVGEDRYVVERGSCLFYHAHVVHEFHNETKACVEFFIVVDRAGTR